MKRSLLLLLVQISFVLSQQMYDEVCAPLVEPLGIGKVADKAVGQRMKEIFDEDQAVRENWENLTEADMWKMSVSDQERRIEVMAFIKDGKLATDLDFFHAAFVFQHGNCPEHFKLANELANESVKLGNEEAKWIYAASLDRYLLAIGEVQKFGTQYTLTDGCTYTLEPVDPATTDEERAEYGVPSLADAEEKAKEFAGADCATDSE
jgi:hypothetical protein